MSHQLLLSLQPNTFDVIKSGVINLFNSYKLIKIDKYYTYLKILSKLKSVEVSKPELIKFEEEEFTLLDFILDYHQ